MSVSDAYLAATVNAAAVAKHHGVKAFVNMSQMTVSQMSITKVLRARSKSCTGWRAGAELVGLPVVHVRPTMMLEGSLLILTGFSQAIKSGSDCPSARVRLRRSQWQTLHVRLRRCCHPQPHIGKIYHYGPQSEHHF